MIGKDMVGNAEYMADFFNKRANSYDEHMKENIKSFEEFYPGIANPIDNTINSINILDLGCGTGLEIQWILEKAPNAIITGIDMSEEMLNRLKKKYIQVASQLRLIQGSYTSLSFNENYYDYVVSGMTIHHLLYDEKLELYEKIYKALKKGGKYIEGDYVETKEMEQKYLEEYWKIKKENNIAQDELVHIDIPFSLETEEKLFKEAGFKDFKVTWYKDTAAIYIGIK